MSNARVLFLLKQRQQKFYDVSSGHYSTSSGLLNSAQFVVDMLTENNVTTKLVQVVDNNAIDKEVSEFKPTHVIIEALWVVPEKFEVLIKLYPHVKWIIRLHSEIPFLANEGVAIEWFYRYIKYKNVVVSPNSPRTTKDLRLLASVAHSRWSDEQLDSKIVYLPNYYTMLPEVPKPVRNGIFDVGCFGAIRPLKNQLIQAVAAVKYAQINDVRLRFHINGNRLEQKGDTVIKNIRALFDGLPDSYELMEHPWYNHEDFLKVVRHMDIGLQLSFTETFNIVTADFVNCGIPVVTSREVPWTALQYQADTTDVDHIVEKMEEVVWVHRHNPGVDITRDKLVKYLEKTKNIWLEYFV
jgi:hypothetical protein